MSRLIVAAVVLLVRHVCAQQVETREYTTPSGAVFTVTGTGSLIGLYKNSQCRDDKKCIGEGLTLQWVDKSGRKLSSSFLPLAGKKRFPDLAIGHNVSGPPSGSKLSKGSKVVVTSSDQAKNLTLIREIAVRGDGKDESLHIRTRVVNKTESPLDVQARFILFERCRPGTCPEDDLPPPPVDCGWICEYLKAVKRAEVRSSPNAKHPEAHVRMQIPPQQEAEFEHRAMFDRH